MFITRVFTPQFVFLPVVLLGLINWLFMPAQYLDIGEKSDINFISTFIAVTWYGLLIASVLAAKLMAKPICIMSTTPYEYSLMFYYLATGLTLLGVLSVLGQIGSPADVLSAISSKQVNSLKDSLYDNYSFGSLTLRYTSSITATYAFYRIVVIKKWGAIDIFNFVAVLICAFVSARILVIQTAFYSIFIYFSLGNNRDLLKRIGLTKLVVIGTAFCTVIVLFTYSRSADTYKAQLGITNPFMVTAVEVGRYTAMPIQVTFGVANLVAGSSSLIENIEVKPWYLLPSFLQPSEFKVDNSGGVGHQWYAGYVDVPRGLTTNSVFASAIGNLGYWAVLGLPFTCFLYGFVFFLFRRSACLESKIYQAVLLYAFFELWRTFYFSAGSFIYYNVLFILFFCVSLALGRHRLYTIRSA